MDNNSERLNSIIKSLDTTPRVSKRINTGVDNNMIIEAITMIKSTLNNNMSSNHTYFFKNNIVNIIWCHLRYIAELADNADG